MRHFLLPIVVALVLTGCEEPPLFGLPFFRFESPLPTDLVRAGAVAFELVVPTGTQADQLTLAIDGEPLDADAWQMADGSVGGTLVGLAPGEHRLVGELTMRFLSLFEATIPARTTFEVGAIASFEVRESVEQLHVARADPDLEVELVDATGRRVAAGVTDYQGSLIFRKVEPGSGYRLATRETPAQIAGPFTVMSIEGSAPPQEFYASQRIEPGYGYITTRDGTRLSVFVTLPGPIEEGPYPTVVNYSGYDPSKPGGPVLSSSDPFFMFLEGLCNQNPEVDPLDVLCVGPNHPTGLIAGLLGYATVGVNLRGTACSGGAYDFFETLQLLDGYDVIETIAAQDWVLHNRVGLVGLSFPGISTLFVARTQPPSLAAITPLSVVANTVVSTLSPGGILNDGFALEWGQQVLDRADPFGHGWEEDRVEVGDTVCEENQLLHSQKVDIIELARSNPFYPPELGDPLAPELFADRIQVPVFTSGSWQDEQTGGHFPALWDDFVNAPIARFQAFNGAHADGLAPHTLIEWKIFLDFYVAQERLPLEPAVPALTPLLFEKLFGARVNLPVERQEEIDAYATFEEALAGYEAEEPVRILFESGGTAFAPGAPETTFELRFPSWPPPQTEPRRWYLHGDGSLRDFEPSEAESASLFRHDAAKGRETLMTLDGGPAPARFLWNGWLPERQAVFVSEPLDEDLVMVGHGSADLWVRCGSEEAELEVVLSEVRPDGLEMYVQSGWLRASQRALAPDATPLRPVKTHLEQDAAPLSTDAFNLARVEIFPFGHVFRAGSRIRLSVETPGGNRARWQFQLTDYGEEVRHAISHSVVYPSSVLLPVIPDVEVPSELPPCELRSQPCRPFAEHVNLLLD